VRGDHPQRVMLSQIKRTEVGLTNSSRIRQHRLENRFQFSGRTRDDLQHLRSRGLLLQRFAQLVEQANILDGDDGLSRKTRNQLDLLVLSVNGRACCR